MGSYPGESLSLQLRTVRQRQGRRASGGTGGGATERPAEGVGQDRHCLLVPIEDAPQWRFIHGGRNVREVTAAGPMELLGSQGQNGV